MGLTRRLRGVSNVELLQDSTVSAGTAKVKGSGPIYPNYLGCYGYETSIQQCSKGSVSCDHSRDAAVVCGNGLTPGKTRYITLY